MAKIFHHIPAYNMQMSASIWPQALRDGVEALEAGHDYQGAPAHTCDLVWMRNKILYESITRGFDYLYMQDADVYAMPTSSPLMQLMGVAEETGAAMVGAMVMLRTRPPKANSHPFKPNAVFEVEKLGTGMVLINLNKVREWYFEYKGPCFNRTYAQYKDDAGNVYVPMREQRIGSDIWFCNVIRAHGQSIWCDSRIHTCHQDGTHTVIYDGERFISTDSAESEGDAAHVPQLVTATGA